MEKDPSPLDTLRQLKEWLDAGTITPQEFETLKRKLLFSENAGPASAPAPSSPTDKPPTIAADQLYPTYPESTPAPEPPRPVVPPVPPVSTTSGPVEDPLLPPVVSPTNSFSREDAVVPPAASAPEFLPPREPSRPLSSGLPPEEEYSTADTLEDDTFPAPNDAASRNPLTTVLIVGGIVALLAVVAYLMLGNKESERLTSTTITAADTLTSRPETGPQAEQIDLPPAAAPETIRVAPVVPATPAPTPDTVGKSEGTAPAAPATTTLDPNTEAAAQTRIQGVLSAFYEDMQAAPFAASTYLAPQVERFYLMQNTTPTAVADELGKTYFPEFLEAQSQIEPGTLKISPPVNDGSRVVTYVEKLQAKRQSLQKHQQTRAQVRARFDKNFKIVYLRQEKLLENTFTE